MNKYHCLILLGWLYCLQQVSAHGYVEDPPNRSSMWRYGFNTPTNYDDNAYFCGGFATQWDVYRGKCGECGDSYGLPRPRSNENTGKYGLGIVSRRYKKNQVITATVRITVNHRGWFRFSVCPLSSNNTLEEETCFQQNVLRLADGTSRTDYYVPNYNPGVFNVKLYLPPNLTCERCVLQWHYHTGNSWGICTDGTGALGCGPQETFRSCSDIAIDN